MRKIIGVLLALVLTLALAVTVSAAGSGHPHGSRGHCVCGGAAVDVGDHESCETVEEWTPLYGTVNFGTLDSGYYYLTGNVTVNQASSIGTVTEVTDSTGTYYVQETERHIYLCLNGYDITTNATRVFYSILQGSSLTVCDCSYNVSTGTFGGTVTGGTSVYGGISYLHAKSTLNIYGGNWTSKAGVTNLNGGLIVVAQDSGDVPNCKTVPEQKSVCNIYNGCLYGGSSNTGGNMEIMHCSEVNLYGGTVRDGSAVKNASGAKGYGGNIYVSNNGVLNLLGTAERPVSILNGTAENSCGNLYWKGTVDLNTAKVSGGSPEVARLVREGHLVSYTEQYTTLAAALQAVDDSSFVQLCADTEEALTVDGTVYLDLNGCDLRGVTITGTLYGMDSTTLGYDGTEAGTLTPASGAPALTVKTAAEPYGGIYRFLAVEEDGGYSFHRFYIGITKLSLKPTTVGMGYKAVFAGDEAVKSALNISQGFGYSLWLDAGTPVKRGYPASKFETTQELTLRVDNFLSTENSDAVNAARAETDVHAVAFIRLADGTEISSSEVSYNFHEVLQTADDAYSTYTQTQQAALQDLGGKFSPIMVTWDVSNIHHAAGSLWTTVDTAGFTALLKKSGIYYDIPTGSYALGEDISLTGMRLRVSAGTQVDLCLNGYTLSDTTRTLSVYGELNICDCHHDGAEGSITSSHSIVNGATSGYYAPIIYAFYNSVTNLYGGNLIATGQMNSAGVVAVSHDGDYTDTAQIPAVFNMYGGSISGGSAVDNGGLVSLWNGSTFNLYAGTLSGGTAGTNGGAVSMASDCTLNIYGGTVTDCSAGSNGGAVSMGSNSTLNMYGGTVSGNTAQGNGGGIYLNKGNMSLFGDARITGNESANVYVTYGTCLREVDMTADASVGITASVHALLAESAGSTQGLFSDEAGYQFQTMNGKLLMSEETYETPGSVSKFSAGFGRACITPEELGLPLSGYGNDDARAHTEVWDDLYVSCIAVTDAKDQTVLLITFDLKTSHEQIADVVLDHVSAVTGVPAENIYLCATHTHSAPSVNYTTESMTRYKSMVCERFAQAASEAMLDRSAATLSTGSFEVDGLNFTRHYSYTDADGVLRYFGDNFGTQVLNSTTAHVTENDPTMHLLKFDRSGQDILLVNWRAHPTMTGGSTKSVLSSDYIGPFRDAVESETGMLMAFFQGAAGNQNTVSRITAEKHNLSYTAYGQELASQLVDNLSCLQNVASGTVQTEKYIYSAGVDHSADDRYEDAKIVGETYWGLETAEERKALLAEYGFTSVYHASAVRAKYGMGETVDLELNVISIGKSIAFYTAPGELWNTIGVTIEAASPFKKTFTVGYSNGDIAYIIHEKALTYESYESLYCRLVMPDSVNDMIDWWTQTLTKLYNG